MVSVFMRGEVSISTPVRQAYLEQCCYERAFQEPNNGSHQQLHLVSHFIQKVEWNVTCHPHTLLDVQQSVLQSSGLSKKP